MLEDLQIQNFALIESVNLEFSQGFTVFTGETGAGKSILIGALSFLLGGKSGIDQIRAGAKEASVSGTFLLCAVSFGIQENPVRGYRMYQLHAVIWQILLHYLLIFMDSMNISH